DVARQRREVACFDGHVLRQRAVAVPVGEAEHPLPHRDARRAVPEGADHSGHLMAGDRRPSVHVAPIRPRRPPSPPPPAPSAHPPGWAVTASAVLGSSGWARSPSLSPAVPADWSVPTIAFMGIVSSRCLAKCARRPGVAGRCAGVHPPACWILARWTWLSAIR